MGTRSQAFSEPALISYLCILQCVNKKPLLTRYPAANRQNTCKTYKLFYSTVQVSTLVPAAILQTYIPLQKFPFL